MLLTVDLCLNVVITKKKKGITKEGGRKLLEVMDVLMT